MRLRQLTSAAAALLISTQAFGQEWVEYTNRQDRFTVNLPAQPTVREFTYTSWLEAKLPARVYTVERGAERYSVTFVDYTQAERVHTEMAKALNCAPDAPQGQCTAAIAGADSAAQGIGAWKYDVLGALDHASEAFLKRDAKVTYLRMGDDRSDHGPADSPDQSGPVEDIRPDPHARESSVYLRGHCSAACARARTVSAVAAVSRCRRETRAIPRQLHEHVRHS